MLKFIREILMIFNFRKGKRKEAEQARITPEDDGGGSAPQERIVIDGRGYENETPSQEEIYNLVDVVETDRLEKQLYEEMLNRLSAIVEKVAKEKVPEIAEKIIREEIEKLKSS